MAWLTSVSSEGTIVESKKYIAESLAIIATNSASYWTRTREITVTRYPGLTKDAAETQASTDKTAGATDAHTENTGGGSFAAVSTFDTTGDWEKVVPGP